MRRWPWITLLAAIVLAALGGHDLLRSAFFSGEQLARSISQLLLEVIVAVLIGLGLIEWLVRTILARRAKRAVSAAGKTET